MDIKDVAALPQLVGIRPPERGATAERAEGSPSFAKLLEDSVAQVNQLQKKADQAIASLASGEATSLHDTMIAMEQADISFRLMMQVRNKIVEAYQEILRMQV